MLTYLIMIQRLMHILLMITYKYNIQHCNIYQIVGAAMSSFSPREKELKTYTLKEYEPEFDRKLVGKHIQRLRTIYSKCNLEKVVTEFASILKWKSKFKSTAFLFLYIVVIDCFQPWMLTFSFLSFLLKNWMVSSKTIKRSHNQVATTIKSNEGHDDDSPLNVHVAINEDISPESNHYDIDLSPEIKPEKTSIRSKIHRFHDVYESRYLLQDILGKSAQLGERVNNIIRFRVPFISSIVVALLIPMTLVLYCFPLRYIILIVGVDEILKGLIRPNTDGALTRLFYFISKVPDNEELKDYDIQTMAEMKSSISRTSSSAVENTGPGCFGDKNKRKKTDTGLTNEISLNEQSAHGLYGPGNEFYGESSKNKISKQGSGRFCHEEYSHSSSSDQDCHIGHFHQITNRNDNKLGIAPDDNVDTMVSLLSPEKSKSVEEIRRFFLRDESPTNPTIKKPHLRLFKK